jgi:hypothetical protein
MTALQGQHLRLDSILDDRRNNDRLTAAQAILEGQATLASLDVLAPGQAVARNPQFWELYREQVRQQQSTMPVFQRAPLILREALIFPYLQGAEFMHWWASSPFADTVPYGPRMRSRPSRSPPAAVPARRPASAAPSRRAWMCSTRTCWVSEIRVLLAELAGRGPDRGADRLGRPLPRLPGRGQARPGRYVAWDEPVAAGRFLRTAGPGLRKTVRRGYRVALDSLGLDGRAVTRYVLAPDTWARWDSLPALAPAEPR